MRSVALSFLAFAASGALAQSAEAPKPTFTVRIFTSALITRRTNPFPSTNSPLRSRLLLSSNSQKTGQNVGLLRKLPRRLPLVARPSAMSANGKSKTLPFPSLKVTKVSSRKAKLPIMPSLLPSPNPLTSRQNL